MLNLLLDALVPVEAQVLALADDLQRIISIVRPQRKPPGDVLLYVARSSAIGKICVALMMMGLYTPYTHTCMYGKMRVRGATVPTIDSSTRMSEVQAIFRTHSGNEQQL